MDNDKKLFEKLLKADGIDPFGVSESERNTFAKILDQQLEQKKSKPIYRPGIWRIIMKNKITKLATAAIIIIAVLLGIEFIGGPSTANITFAEVAKQIRNARTVTFTMEIKNKLDNKSEFMHFKIANKEPGLKRVDFSDNLVFISDLRQKKSITIDHLKKEYTEKNLKNKQVNKIEMHDFFEKLRTLPDRANEILGKREIDGQVAQGFRVYEDEKFGMDCTFWVNVQTSDLIRIEGNFANSKNIQMIATDFKFDIDLGNDEEFFSLKPPVDYRPKEPLKINKSAVNYQDLINLLKWWTKNFDVDFFPPSLEPAEFKKAGQELDKAGKKLQIQGTEDERMQEALKGMRGIQFVLMMRPENDWHYAGKGVKIGDANTPICWYRPKDSETYRVIYGDLTVEDVTLENLPK